jgi:hypothetical protein
MGGGGLPLPLPQGKEEAAAAKVGSPTSNQPRVGVEVGSKRGKGAGWAPNLETLGLPYGAFPLGAIHMGLSPFWGLSH